VLRIGSDPQCEICLPMAELAPHALTLEYRGGTYRAYNRGASPIQIGAAAVQPGAAGAWGEDQAAQLPGDVRLVLTFDGDPQPCPQPEKRADDGFPVSDQSSFGASAAAAAGEAKKPSSKSSMQLAIIGVCGLATIAFLFMPSGGETTVQNRPTFESIVTSSLSKDAELRALTQQLQYAQAAFVRGHKELAGTLFLKLRDRLIRQRDSLPAADREDAQKMLDYAQDRLSQLQ
jgi:hypothetical protein